MTTDTTEFKYLVIDKSGHSRVNKAYLDAYLDMFNGELISYRITESPNLKTIQEAQLESIQRAADCPYRRTFHSDQGWAYQIKVYSNKFKRK